MRGLAVLLLGALVAVLLGGCRHGCPKAGYAPCTFTYEVDRHCERTWHPCEPQVRPAPPLLPCDD